MFRVNSLMYYVTSKSCLYSLMNISLNWYCYARFAFILMFSGSVRLDVVLVDDLFVRWVNSNFSGSVVRTAG